jgi:hypothetical protein
VSTNPLSVIVLADDRPSDAADLALCLAGQDDEAFEVLVVGPSAPSLASAMETESGLSGIAVISTDLNDLAVRDVVPRLSGELVVAVRTSDLLLDSWVGTLRAAAATARGRVVRAAVAERHVVGADHLPVGQPRREHPLRLAAVDYLLAGSVHSCGLAVPLEALGDVTVPLAETLTWAIGAAAICGELCLTDIVAIVREGQGVVAPPIARVGRLLHEDDVVRWAHDAGALDAAERELTRLRDEVAELIDERDRLTWLLDIAERSRGGPLAPITRRRRGGRGRGGRQV